MKTVLSLRRDDVAHGGIGSMQSFSHRPERVIEMAFESVPLRHRLQCVLCTENLLTIAANHVVRSADDGIEFRPDCASMSVEHAALSIEVIEPGIKNIHSAKQVVLIELGGIRTGNVAGTECRHIAFGRKQCGMRPRCNKAALFVHELTHGFLELVRRRADTCGFD